MTSLSVDTGELSEGGHLLRLLIGEVGYHGPVSAPSCGSRLVASQVAESTRWLQGAGMTTAMRVERLARGAEHLAVSFAAAETDLAGNAREVG